MKKNGRKYYWLPLFVAGWVVFLTLGAATANALTINSDGSWKSYDVEVTDWTTLAFDDSAWRNAYQDYPPWPPSLGAHKIWDWPSTGVPSGQTGPSSAFFRKTFTLAVPAVSGQATLIVDDDFDFYLNGTLVASNHDNTASGIWVYDITPYLVVGTNIIAINGIDSYGGYEHLEYKSDINAVPLPGAMWLLGSGLLGLGAVGWRRKRKG